MSDFVFQCPHCDQSLEGSDELFGKTIACPACNGQIEIPFPDASEETPPGTGEKPAGRSCVGCGVALEADAVICVQCGTNQLTGKKLETVFDEPAEEQKPKPSPFQPKK
ncbi:MAG: hypothetical protein C0404_08585 [Verrucomicrobia bacterium]|nr:hypothetical protein [Verrucomicrobiota bacterium]